MASPLDIFNQQKAVLQPSGFSLFAPVMDFLGGAYQAYSANPQAGGTALAGASNAATKGMARGQARRQALASAWKDYAGATDASIFNKALTGLDSTGYGGVIDANQAQGIQRVNQNPNMNKFLKGEALQVDDYGYLDPQIAIEYAKQQAAATNFANQKSGLNAIDGGQQASLAAQALDQLNMLKAPTDPRQPMLAEDPNNAALQAGVAKQTPTITPDFANLSPFAMPSDVPNNIAEQQQAGLEDVQKQAALAEAKRKAMATEALDKRELDLKQQGNYYKNYPPSGGSGRAMSATEYTAALAKQLGLSPSQTLQVLNDPSNFDYEGVSGRGAGINQNMGQVGQEARSGLSSKASSLLNQYRQLLGR